MANYKGKCFCGEVEVEISGEPVAMMICHCEVCRSWSASPVNGATLFKPEDVSITKGADSLRSYAKNEGHDRSWCDKCGGHVLADHRDTYGIVDVYAAVIDGLTSVNAPGYVDTFSTVPRVTDISGPNVLNLEDRPHYLGIISCQFTAVA